MAGKIKTKTTTRYNYAYSQEKEEWVVANNHLTMVQTFDEGGHMTSEKSFNRDGESGEHNEYVYNDKGQVLEERIYFEGNELAERHIYTYREDGKVLLEIIEYQDTSADKVHYTYDSFGNLIERKQVDEDEVLESLEQYVYEGEVLKKESVWDGDMQLISEAIHTYDAQGNLTETHTRGQEDHEEVRMVYEYDEKGNRDCAEKFSKDGQIVSRTTFTFNEKGNVIETFDEDTTTSKTTKFQYDEHDNVVLHEEFNDKEELNHRIERVWDESGELMESIVYVDRHDQGPDQYYAVKQEFEYYS
jgi:YD repeat-containing protein